MEFAERLRALMQARGISGTELARRAHFTKGYVSLLVNGKRHPPLPTARHIDEILGGGGILTSLAARPMRQQLMPAAEAPWLTGDEDEDDVRRRELLAAIGGVAAGAGFTELERLRRGVDSALSASPSEADADTWEWTATGYAHEVGILPARDLLPRLLADLGEIGDRLAGSSGRIRHRLARAAGQLAALTAMALTNLGDPATARRWWRTAARAADEAGDYRAAALVRGRHAVFSLYASQPAMTALNLASEAIAAGRNAPCAGVASGYAARAQALAQLGRSQDARRALNDLAEVFERLPVSVSADRRSVWGWSEMRLRHVESYVHTQAGDVRAASRAQDAALRLYPKASYQGPAQVELHRAECLIRAGDIDGGAKHATWVLGTLPPERRDGLVTGTARAALRAIPPQHCHRPAVCSARELIAPLAGMQ